ncbi:MAG: HAD-IIIA family hydrolase [Bacillota bacterium]
MIKLLVMDVDGTLTDGKIYIGSQGEAVKAFNVKDGYAIGVILPQIGITPCIITGRKSEITEQRCKELNIKLLYQGIHDKLPQLKEVVSDLKIDMSEVAYIGDDLNDLEVMQQCGYVGCPKDAVQEIKQVAHFVSAYNGGNGAVRGFIETLNK